MEKQLVKHEYNGQIVEFDMVNKNVMVNATEMAKVFNEQVDNFLRNKATKDFIEAIKSPHFRGNLGIESEADLIQSKGRNGTWMHRILALKFAAWLDPYFEVWVYSTIESLLFGNQMSRKALLLEAARLKTNIAELELKLKDNETYRELVNKKAELLRLGKDLKANDDAENQMQLDI
jgi:hypothetical protein